MRRFTLALLCATFWIPASAEACSCAADGTPRERAREILAASDAALIGTLRSVSPVSEPGPGQEAVLRYRVRRDYKARLGRFVGVRATTDSASCGLPTGEGERYALGLSGGPGEWRSGLCSLVRPRALRRAAGQDRARAATARCGGYRPAPGDLPAQLR